MWNVYFDDLQPGAVPSYEIVGQPEFFAAVNTAGAGPAACRTGRCICAGTCCTPARRFCRSRRAGEFQFFGKVLSGQPEQEPRWKRAAHVIDGSIGEALGQLYVEKYFPPEAKARMNELVENLKAVFHDRLEKVPWMTCRRRGPKPWPNSPASRKRSVTRTNFAITPRWSSGGTIIWATSAAPLPSSRTAKSPAWAGRWTAPNGA